MTKYLLSTFIILLSANNFANDCSVSFADKIYSITNAQVQYVEKGCNKSQIELLNEILTSVEGNLNLHFSRELKENGINLLTKNTVFINLEKTIKTQFSIQESWKVKFHSNKPLKSFNVDSLNSIDLSCNNCETLGKKKLKITSGQIIKWLDIEVLKPVKAIVAKNEIALNYKSIDALNVEKKLIYTSDDKGVFKNLDEVSFYKSNKVISPGEVIKKRDLSPINLVTFGVPVKIILNSNGIKLTGTATPLSTGKLQDFVKVKNTKTNKVFTAQVIGLNKVKVEL